MVRQDLLREIKQLTPAEQFRLVEDVLRSLRSSVKTLPPAPRYIKLGGLWSGYTFDFDEIKAARREAWAGSRIR
jgi:hypothetical protein